MLGYGDGGGVEGYNELHGQVPCERIRGCVEEARWGGVKEVQS